MLDELFDYPAYLSAKKSIDDQSLNKQVWSIMCHWLRKRQEENSQLKILEIGSGIGTMIERLVDEDIIEDCIYTAIEQEPDFKDHALKRLSDNSRFSIEVFKQNWTITSRTSKITVIWISGDAMEINNILDDSDYDLVISHAVIDLLPVPDFLPRLFSHLKTGAGFYFSLNFSGKTQFSPPLGNDELIYREYHRDMDKRFSGIDWQASRTGELLGEWLIEQGHKVLATGSSDWILTPGDDTHHGFFISNILQTIEKALQDLPGLNSWLIQRRNHLQSGDLSFTASNMDYFGVI